MDTEGAAPSTVRETRTTGNKMEVGGGKDGSVRGVAPGGESRSVGVGKVVAERGASSCETKVSGGSHMEMSPGGVSQLMRRTKFCGSRGSSP
jgi:hypothetical protein